MNTIWQRSKTSKSHLTTWFSRRQNTASPELTLARHPWEKDSRPWEDPPGVQPFPPTWGPKLRLVRLRKGLPGPTRYRPELKLCRYQFNKIHNKLKKNIIKLLKWIDMAIISSLFNSIQFNSEITLLNWIAFRKKNIFRIDSVNSMYDPESPKVTLLQVE